MSDYYERRKNLKSWKMMEPSGAAWITAAAVSFPMEYVFANGGMYSHIFGNWAPGVICLAAAGLAYWFFDWRICRQLRIEDDEQRK